MPKTRAGPGSGSARTCCASRRRSNRPMKSWLNNLPIRRKLMLLACLASGLALVVSGFVHTIADYRAGHENLVHRMATQAKMTASNSTAALAFDDSEAGVRTLDALRADPAIVRAQIV